VDASGTRLVAADPALAGACSAAGAALGRFPGAHLAPAASPRDADLATALGLDRMFLVTSAGDPDRTGLSQNLARMPLVFAAVEVLGSGHLDADDAEEASDRLPLPNDPYFPLLYALENSGQSIWGVDGTVDADIDAAGAWGVSKGSPQVIVAIIDSGVSLGHPDLAGQVVRGRNFTTPDVNDFGDDYVGHGTHVAGIIGGLWNNGVGITGLAPACRLMPIRAVDRFGFTAEEWVASGIIWAVDNGASVLNISIGFPEATSLLHAAVQYADAKGAVICASSGNIATDPIGYPARYHETICVGATDNRDEVTSFTSTGPQMTIAAPGRDIYSTWDTTAEPDTYKRKSGTSFAAPYVTGAAALVRSVNPTLSPAQVRGVLTGSAEDVGDPGWDEASGSGRLNALGALLLARRTPGDADPTCAADLNADGALSFADVQIFLQAYSDGSPPADFNHDLRIDFYDLQSFLAAYGGDCETTSP
jgi:subtilisin family serine protease